MLKIIVAFTLLLAVVRAGYIGAPLAYSAPIVAAPAALPVATSYQNTFKISASPLVVKTAPLIAAPAVISTAPIIKAAPLLAAPTYHHYAAYH